MTIAALLVAHSCNVGYTPVIGAADALKYGRLSHVDQTYLRLATYRAANATLIDCQASIPLAQAWGGGLVASVDGIRIVVPVPSVYARPNPKYFGRRGGATCAHPCRQAGSGSTANRARPGSVSDGMGRPRGQWAVQPPSTGSTAPVR